MQNFPSVDYDGDPVEIEIISGNVDTDGYGISFLSLSTGNLVVEYADELSNLMGQKFSLTFSLSDGRGKSSETQGAIWIDNGLTFASDTNLENMWVSSDWLARSIPQEVPGFIILNSVGFMCMQMMPMVIGFGMLYTVTGGGVIQMCFLIL